MLGRVVIALAGLLAAGPSVAEQLDADAARRFVVGKLFAFNCFEGTRGTGRIYRDGSVAGSIQFGGRGAVRFVTLPAGTLQVRGENVCASLRGIPFEPCFDLQKTDSRSFRGSVYGFSFAYCNFTHSHPRPQIVRATTRPGRPKPIHSAAVTGRASD